MLALLGGDDHHPAIVDAATGEQVTYGELRARVRRRADAAADEAGTVALRGMANDLASVEAELGLAEAGVVVALVDPATPAERVAALADAYRAERIEGCRHHPDARRPASADPVAGPDRVLLPTSGSTGNPKVVRLSEGNLLANAHQIAAALELTPAERGLAPLPLFYSYGLSVLHSHLAAGATVVLTGASAIRPEFRAALREHAVTSLPGVPSSYDLYERAGLLDDAPPSVRSCTQAGGRMAPERVREVHRRLEAHGTRLWVMYGQTEATARLCVLHPDDLPEHAGSVGPPVPGAAVHVEGPDEAGVGELVFEGANVMLGYASDRSGLGGADELGGRLRTGDLGRVDEAGRVWLHGRLKRITKVAGRRVSLDDLEELVRPATAAALDGGDRVVLFVVGTAGDATAAARAVERALAVPPRTVDARALDVLPLTAAGKVDYPRLRDAV